MPREKAEPRTEAEKVRILNRWANSDLNQKEFAEWYNNSAFLKEDPKERRLAHTTLGAWIKDAMENPGKYPGLQHDALKVAHTLSRYNFSQAEKVITLNAWAISGKNQNDFIEQHNQSPELKRITRTTLSRWAGEALNSQDPSKYRGLNYEALQAAQSRNWSSFTQQEKIAILKDWETSGLTATQFVERHNKTQTASQADSTGRSLAKGTLRNWAVDAQKNPDKYNLDARALDFLLYQVRDHQSPSFHQEGRPPGSPTGNPTGNRIPMPPGYSAAQAGQHPTGVPVQQQYSAGPHLPHSGYPHPAHPPRFTGQRGASPGPPQGQNRRR